jgi:hypothetical protein
MSINDSPALFDPALFWGGLLVILFYFPLRGFAPSREPITLQGVSRCLSIISRKDAKPRRWSLMMRAKLRQTLPLPEESVVLRRIEHRLTGTHNAHPQSSRLMHPCKTIDNERLTPNTLRGFASSREPITLQGVSRCLSIISRKDAKTGNGALRSMRNFVKPFHFLKNACVWTL